MGGGQVDMEPGLASAALVPHLPRLVIDWLATEPGTTHRDIEGTVVFVDISGFTKLSERLARRGKVGAEVLAETISACFTSLLAVAYAERGGLLKFGGDALLLLFTGPGHELRACRAAIAMRAVLREVGQLDELGQRVVLRMSVGVHSGRFHFFLVGASHRELIITGPAASTTVEMEHAAEAGEILVSSATAEALPPKLVGAAKGDGRLLRRVRPEPLVDLTERVEVPPYLDLSKAVPVALRQSLLDGTLEPEHRRATVAFVHFDGTDELIEQRGAPQTAARLAALVESAQGAAEEHGVTFLATDVDHDGGKLIFVAGAPTASGDDEQRMLLALHQLVTADAGMPVRIGVNRGDVFVGDIGPPYRRTYTVMGDTVNLAARVMARAATGQLLATQGVLDRSRTRFDTVALEPFMVKGKAKPVHALIVGDIVGRRGPGDEQLPLIGREEELDVLIGALDGARRGQGSVIEVVGDPGLGKSRLIEELRARAGDVTLLIGACETYESSTPYYPFRHLMRGLLGLTSERRDDDASRLLQATARADPALAPWAPLVGVVADVAMAETPETASLEERFRPVRLAEVVLALLRHLRPSPTLMLFEDVHWMDEASSALLAYLGAAVYSLPWFICTTRRDVATGHVIAPEAGNAVRLEPLTVEAAIRLATEAAANLPVAPRELAALAERAEGSPLFLKELVATIAANGSLHAIPDSVEGLIMARIDGLATADRNVLRRLAVLGRRFPISLVGAVVDDVPTAADPVWDRVSGFVRLDGDGLLTFDHALIRDAAYEGLPYRLRRFLHARAGDEIMEVAGKRAEDQAEVLSLHYINAQRYADAWRYARIAAERARAVYANVEAAEFYERAIEASRHLSDSEVDGLVELQERLGEVRERAGKYAGADAAYRHARKLARDPVAEARLLSKVASLRAHTDRCSRALAWITRGLHLLEGLEEPAAAFERAQLLAAYAQFCMEECDPKRALMWCERAIETAETSGNLGAEALARRIFDWALLELGRLEEPVHSLRSLMLYEELDDLRGQAKVLSNLGVFDYWAGRWNEALDYWERSSDVVQRTGDDVTKALTTLNIAEIKLDQGRPEEARALLEGAARALRAAGDRAGTALAEVDLGRTAYQGRRYEEATALLEHARDELGASGHQRLAFEASARLAECRLLSGDARGALAAADELLLNGDMATGGGGPLLHRVRGVALHCLEDDDGATAALERSLSVARSRNVAFDAALALRALADVDLRRRGELLAESQELLDGLGGKILPTALGPLTQGALREPVVS